MKMFNNRVSRKDLYTSNPGQILQQQAYRRDLNDSAFQSSENYSDHSSQMESSQGSYEVCSQRFSQSYSQPENSSSQKFYRKYMTKAPLFKKDSSSYTNERPTSRRQADYLDQLETNKRRAKERDNRDLLNTFVSLVKDCSDEVKTAVDIIKDSVTKSLSDSAGQSAVLIEKINEGLSVHYQQLLGAIQTDNKQRLTTSELKEVIATRDAKIEHLEFQLETAQKERDEKVLAFLKEAYEEQKETTKSQLEQLHNNQKILNEKHIKTLKEQQDVFNKEMRSVESNKECKHCAGQEVQETNQNQELDDGVHNQHVLNRGCLQHQGMYAKQHNIQQDAQVICTTLPPAVCHANHACCPHPHIMASRQTVANTVKQPHGLTSHQPNSVYCHQDNSRSMLIPQPLSSSIPSISPIVSASFAKWSKELLIKKPSPVATVVPLVKGGAVDNTIAKHYGIDAVDLCNDEARRYPVRQKVILTRESERPHTNTEKLSRHSTQEENMLTNTEETNQKLQIKRNNRKYNNKESNRLKSQSNTKITRRLEINSYTGDNKLASVQCKAGKKIHKKKNTTKECQSGKKSSYNKKIYKNQKPNRKSKGLQKSSSYSNINSPSLDEDWKFKRHSSLTTADNSSSDDDDELFLSFLGDNSPPTKLCKFQQGEKLVSSEIISKYPDTDDAQQKSSQESSQDSSMSYMQKANNRALKKESIRSEKIINREDGSGHDVKEDDDEDDDIFSLGENAKRKSMNEKINNNKDHPSNRRQLLNVSDTNLLEISKYIRQLQSRMYEK